MTSKIDDKTIRKLKNNLPSRKEIEGLKEFVDSLKSDKPSSTMRRVKPKGNFEK
jgi:hypothetical protein